MGHTNKEYIALAVSGTRTGDQNFNISDAHGVGASVVVDIGSITAGSLVATIQGKDLISGKYYDILASGAMLTPQTKILTVYPGIAVAANVSANNVIPYAWRVNIVAASGTANYSVGANIID